MLRFSTISDAICYGLGFIVLLLGLIVMIGWYGHNVALIQISLNFPPMQFNSALCFFLSGASLLLCQNSRLKISGWLGILVFLVGCITLSQYIFHTNIGLDQLLMQAYIKKKSAFPGRMAPNTAICFIFSGLMLALNCFLKEKKWACYSALFLNIVIGFLGLISILGYIFNIQAIYSWGNFTGMAVHTAVGFLLLSLASFSLIFQNFIKYQAKDSYFLVILVGSMSLILFIISWQVLVSYQSGILKYVIERELVYGQSEMFHTLNEKFIAINRLFLRANQNKKNQSIIYENDVKNYFLDYQSLNSIVIKNSTGKLQFFSRDDSLKNITEKIIMPVLSC